MMQSPVTPTFHRGYDRLIRIREVQEITSLSRSTIYHKVEQGSFPEQVRLGPNIVAWYLSDVLEWVRNPKL